MTETLANLMQRVAGDIERTCDSLKSVSIGFALLQGYVAGTSAPAPNFYQNQNVLSIGNYENKEIERMLINLNLKGSVRERSNGLLELRFWKDGARVSVYGKTEAELIQKFNVKRKERKKKQPSETVAKTTLYGWLDKWVKLYKTDTVKERTLYAIEHCISKHIKGNFPDKALSSLQPLEIEENLKKIDSTRMRKYTYQILNEALKRALALRLVKENPFALVDVPKHEAVKGTPLSVEEQEQLKATLEGSVYREYFLFLLYSGCRRGEGLSAQWEDVDFEKERLFVRGTKTKKSRSFIPLFSELRALLKEMRSHGASGKIFDFTEHQVEIAFKKVCPAHHIHDLRHTFATNCIEAGVDLKAVQSWLRHTTIGMTADTYAHATDKYLDAEAEKLKK